MRRSTRWSLVAGLLALALLAGGCLPVPAHRGPLVSGVLVDASTGEPIPAAIVVVRYDARHDDLLPDRDLLAHVEVSSDAAGRFEVGPIWRPGLSLWPLARVEARVAAVIHEGYRCAGPVAVPSGSSLEIALDPSEDPSDRRISCRPVAAEPKVVPRYVAAWRALHPEAATHAERARGREIERVLDARTELGFGVNCEGPAHDLAVSPDGERVAFQIREMNRVGMGAWVGIVRAADSAPIERLPVEVPTRGRWQLGWTGPDELVLWEPTNDLAGAHSLALVSLAGGPPQVLWRADSPGPASPGYEPNASRWARSGSLGMGRSFEIRRSVDPVTGLAREALRVSHADGRVQDVGLPGEPCGGRARARSAPEVADRGRVAFDLRHVRGACRAVAVDLWSSAWRVLDDVDDARSATTCREARSIPASQLSAALGGYMDDLRLALEAGGADPKASFSIRIAEDGATSAVSRGFDGETRALRIPDFPLSTPLRRIDVAVLGAAGAGSMKKPETREALSPL